MMEHGECGRYRPPQHEVPREMTRTSHRLFPIREMPPAYECGLLDAPVERNHRARRPGTEFVRRCASATSPSRRIDHRTTFNGTTPTPAVESNHNPPLTIYIAPGIRERLRVTRRRRNAELHCERLLYPRHLCLLCSKPVLHHGRLFRTMPHVQSRWFP